MVTPAARREAVRFFRDSHQMSERGACQMAAYSLNAVTLCGMVTC